MPTAASLQVGDVIVCPFVPGKHGMISRSPDNILVHPAKGSKAPIERVPMVCTVRAARKSKTDPAKLGCYIVQPDRPLADADYDRVVDADFTAGTLKVQARYPTYFPDLMVKTVRASIDEASSGAPTNPTLRITLRHGKLHRSMDYSETEATRQGMRLNWFVARPPPARATKPVLKHPKPRPSPEGWTPKIIEHSGYFLVPTDQLLSTIPRALESVTLEQLMDATRHRITQILALQAYDPIGLATPDECRLEHAITALTRLALVTHPARVCQERLVAAENRIVTLRARVASSLDLLALLNRARPSYRLENTSNEFLCDIPTYLAATKTMRTGQWALTKRDIEQGQVRLSRNEAETLLTRYHADEVFQEKLEPDADSQDFLNDLHAHANVVLSLLDAPIEDAKGPLRTQDVAPCISNILHKATTPQPLGVAEQHAAASFLRAAGCKSNAIKLAVSGPNAIHDDKSTLRNLSTRVHISLPCQINKMLGICSWECNVASPMAFYNARSAA